MTLRVSVKPPRKKVIWFIGASNEVAFLGDPADLSTSYHGRNLTTAQADIPLAVYKSLPATWDAAYNPAAWTTLQALGGNISAVPNPRHGSEIACLCDLTDAAKMAVAGIVDATGGTDLGTDWAGSVGTAARARLLARMNDLAAPGGELEAVVIGLGLADMSDQTKANAFAANLAALEAATRALNIVGAATFKAYIHAVHSSIGVGETYRQTVIDQIASYVASDTSKRFLIAQSGRDCYGASVVVEDAESSHWRTPGLNHRGNLAARAIWRNQLYPFAA